MDLSLALDAFRKKYRKRLGRLQLVMEQQQWCRVKKVVHPIPVLKIAGERNFFFQLHADKTRFSFLVKGHPLFALKLP